MIKEWDEIDEWAAKFGRWSDLSKSLDLPKRHNADYIPPCFECYGTGHKIKDMITKEVVECRKCNGTGLRRMKPKFLDEEIREIVKKIGIERVIELIKRYGQIRKR